MNPLGCHLVNDAKTRKTRIDEKIAPLVQPMHMYEGVGSKVIVGIGYREFGIKLIVHQGSAYSPLSLLIVLKCNKGFLPRLSIRSAVCKCFKDQCWVHEGSGANQMCVKI